jgi:DNA gyrase/topoisomerase IV subunit A
MTQGKKTVKDLDNSSTKDTEETKELEDSQEEKKAEAKEELSEEEEIERDKKILEALGFLKKENGEKIQYKLNGGDIIIGCSFTPHYPKGIVWAKKNGTDALFPDEEVKDLPVIKRFYNIKEGKEQMPEIKIAQSQQQFLLQLPGKEKQTLIKDLHYYERDGKMILGKEGELKLAAQAENRVNTEILRRKSSLQNPPLLLSISECVAG